MPKSTNNLKKRTLQSFNKQEFDLLCIYFMEQKYINLKNKTVMQKNSYKSTHKYF